MFISFLKIIFFNLIKIIDLFLFISFLLVIQLYLLISLFVMFGSLFSERSLDSLIFLFVLSYVLLVFYVDFLFLVFLIIGIFYPNFFLIAYLGLTIITFYMLFFFNEENIKCPAGFFPDYNENIKKETEVFKLLLNKSKIKTLTNVFSTYFVKKIKILKDIFLPYFTKKVNKENEEFALMLKKIISDLERSKESK